MMKDTLTERQRYWLGHLEACERAGQTSKGYAREHGLSVAMLYTWRKKLVAQGRLTRSRGSIERAVVSFDRIEVVESRAPVVWRIVLPNGIEIGFTGAIDEPALAAALGAAHRL